MCVNPCICTFHMPAVLGNVWDTCVPKICIQKCTEGGRKEGWGKGVGPHGICITCVHGIYKYNIYI